MKQFVGFLVLLFVLGVLGLAGYLLVNPDSTDSVLSTIKSPEVWSMLAILGALAIVGVAFTYGVGRAIMFCVAICVLLLAVYLVYELLFPNGVVIPLSPPV